MKWQHFETTCVQVEDLMIFTILYVLLDIQNSSFQQWLILMFSYMMLRAVPQSILLSYWFYMNVCHLLKFVIRQPWKRKEMRYVQWVIICWNGGGYCYLLCTVLCSPTNGKQSQSLQLKSMHNSVRRNVCILAKKKIIILKLRVQTHTICSRKKSNIW